MKMKLTKIVYDHTDEGIKAVTYHVPCDDDDPLGVLVVDEYSSRPRLDVLYTPREWENVLYWIRSNRLAIDVVKAIDEVSHG